MATKPINVEAQRIQKVLQDTHGYLKVLSLLSNELFESIQSRPDDEIIAAFGEHIGSLLNSEAECEKDFETVNVLDAVKMEPLDSDMFESGHDRRAAYRNAHQIKSNILKLVHIFRRDDMQAKLSREFRDLANKPTNNEIANFEKQFENMKSLWFTKLATSFEEHNRMQEQVETSSKRVKELTE
mmetsp:Transcript_22825/g.28296  ORF Transcript_22825/g.28296 Transcript_22825/m.28296 type:complete len:184 (+) Transcript_22825:23-574(+)